MSVEASDCPSFTGLKFNILLIPMSLQSISCLTFPSTEVRSCIRCASVLAASLSVIHIVHRVPVDFPREVNGDETENQPAEEDFEDAHSHVVGEPVVHKLGQERQAAVGDAR